MILPLYRFLTRAGGPAISFYLARRMRAGKEDSQRFGERCGIANQSRPAGGLIWVHAASVGEAQSLLPLIGAMLDAHPTLHVLMTTGTVTSAALMAERLPPRAFHHYVPVDRPRYVRRFLEFWRPDLVLWAESEFWPNLLRGIAQRHIPLILINGRISQRSFRSWTRFSGTIRTLLGAFTLCLGQSGEDAERLRLLGARRSDCVGNIKFAVPPLPVSVADLTDVQGCLGSRPVWLAAATHPGEEEIAGRVHQALAPLLPGLVTIIVPRHPQRGAAIAEQLTGSGFAVARRDAGERIGPATDIYVADTLGELGLFYRLADVVFMGKSLAGGGGQNPIEPARLGCAILFGPDMSNFNEISARMTANGAALQIADEQALAQAVLHLLTTPQARDAMAAAALVFAESEAGVLERIMGVLTPYLERLEQADARP